MHVKCLEHVEYGPNGWGYESHKKRHPSWDEIELAIRRLDRFLFPYVFLWATEDVKEQVLDDGGDYLNVMGGEGAYWIAGSFNGYFERRVDYPEQGEGRVEVWTSDQGMTTLERHVLHDLEAVIRTVRYYCDHGDFDPAIRWQV